MGHNTVVAALGKANLDQIRQTPPTSRKMGMQSSERKENQLLPNWHLEVSSEALARKSGLCGLKFLLYFVDYFAVIHFYREISYPWFVQILGILYIKLTSH